MTQKKDDTQMLEGNLKDTNIVQKSNPLFGLWKSDLALSEFKILDTYLSRINSRNPESRKVKFSKSDLEHLLGVKRIKQFALDERLKRLMGHVVKLDDPESDEGFILVTLFEKAYCKKENYGVDTIELECSQSAMKYIFNVENIGYFRYQIRNIASLRSLYSYIMYSYLKRYENRKTWIVGIDELMSILNCAEESYPEYKEFNRRVLKRCYTEIIEKTDLRYSYSLVDKNGNPVKRVRFDYKEYGIRFTIEKMSGKFIDISSIEPIELPDIKEDEDENAEKKYSNDTNEFLAEACENEFNDEEMSEIFSILTLIDVSYYAPDVCEEDLKLAQFHFLMRKYGELNRRAEATKITSRFGYFIKMLESVLKEQKNDKNPKEKKGGKKQEKSTSYDIDEIDDFQKNFLLNKKENKEKAIL